MDPGRTARTAHSLCRRGFWQQLVCDNHHGAGVAVTAFPTLW
ncbi:hypothetical protein [Streptomyces sp. NPDC001833]